MFAMKYFSSLFLLFRSAIYGVTSFGLSCAHNIFPGVYAKITEDVKKWIKAVATGTQDECNSRDYFLWKKMKKSADFEEENFETEDEDQYNPGNIKTSQQRAKKNMDNNRTKIRTTKKPKGVNATNRKQSLKQKKENNLSYVRRLLALLQTQGKM